MALKDHMEADENIWAVALGTAISGSMLRAIPSDHAMIVTVIANMANIAKSSFVLSKTPPRLPCLRLSPLKIGGSFVIDRTWALLRAVLPGTAALAFALDATTPFARANQPGNAGPIGGLHTPIPLLRPVSVVTYHYDNSRTGWNFREAALDASKVASPSFGLLHTVTLDDQVDAQPLVIAGERLAGQPQRRNVLYVATENDTVYAIDANGGQILAHRNLGAPVPESKLPGQCNNNGANVGINSTPVIDAGSNTMYVIAYTWSQGAPQYTLHALDLATLADAMPPQTIVAHHPMPNGGNYRFNVVGQRQRPGLLEQNGTIYAGFGSFCDFDENDSRGWLLGWNAASLSPLPANQLNDTRLDAGTPECPAWNSGLGNCFLASVWMSGYGVAGDASGSLYFTTGNSSPGTFGHDDIQESAVKLSGDLNSVQDYFTPKNEQSLDDGDTDLGSGGIMVLPDQAGSIPHLAVAGGKDGTMYLLDRDKMGGFSSTANNIVGSYDAGACWCGPSYFTSSDGVGRVVTGAGDHVTVWKIVTAPSTGLQLESPASVSLSSAQDPGLMTSVSSNGTAAGTAVIWAVQRPVDGSPANVTLWAFDPGTRKTLFHAAAGTWPNTNGNANVVPVVANGLVFVASFKQLAIFGLGANGKAVIAHPLRPALPVSGSDVFGTVEKIAGQTLELRLRNGTTIAVDASGAARNHASVIPLIGRPLEVRGQRDAAGTLHADSILRAKRDARAWELDRFITSDAIR
jgi:hypothetical protein